MNMILVNEGQLKPEESFSSTKTQYAPPDAHISIIKLLRFLKSRYIPDLKVFDEGEYWDTGDKEKLIERMNFLRDKINMVADALMEVDVEFIEKCSTEQLAKIIEKKFKKDK